MKMAKKFLAVALAGVLALSVLTGCGNSVKSKDVAKALTKMGINAEQDKDVDKAAENTLTAIEAIINSETNTNADEEQKITLDNAVGTTGKLIAASGVMTGADTPEARSRRLWAFRLAAQTRTSWSVLLWSRPRMPRRTQTCRRALW